MIELLILDALTKRDFTMYAIQRYIRDYFGAFTKPGFGSIKPALNRLEERGCITSRKMMSDGGKLSGFYTITSKGKNEIIKFLLEDMSENPVQFMSDARIKLALAYHLSQDDKKTMFLNMKTRTIQHKNKAESILQDEYNPLTFYQKIMLDNTICEYSNFITIIEGLEKDNARNSQ